MKGEKKRGLISFFAILLLFILLRLPTLYEPFGRDQGIFATIASGLLQGKIPYRDLWDHKPPGIYFLYAFAFKVLGREMRSISLLDGLYTLFTLLFFFKLAKELFNRRVAYLSTFLFAILASGIFFLGWWGRGQPEVFLLLPLLGMIYLLNPVTAKERPPFFLLCAGILGGIAFSLKSTIFPLFFLFFFFLLIEDGINSKGILKGMSKIFLFSFGIIVALLPFIIFFWTYGALDDAIYSIVTFNLTAHINHPYDLDFLIKLKDNFNAIGTKIPFLWATVSILTCYGFAQLYKEERRKRALLILWSIGTILSICMGWWLFYYHFVILIPPLALLTSYGFFQLFDRLPSQGRKAHQMIRSLILYLFIPFLLLEFLFAYYHSYVSTGIISALIGVEKVNAEEIYSRYKVQEYNTITDFSFREDYRLADYLKAHTNEGEKIFIWGWESLVYFLSEIEPTSRFIFIYPLIQSNLNIREGTRKILWAEFQEKEPQYFIVAKNDQNPIDEIGSERRLAFFPEIEELLKCKYVKEKETERFIIYRRIT
ncbi:MAG: glycosyltransferase family 39 protein [Proteobacteria bacterium]|nr:glycosyltransferase family 39 protein [Pseudomonadota bacterium]